MFRMGIAGYERLSHKKMPANNLLIADRRLQ
jgi:hypothetical protein